MILVLPNTFPIFKLNFLLVVVAGVSCSTLMQYVSDVKKHFLISVCKNKFDYGNSSKRKISHVESGSRCSATLQDELASALRTTFEMYKSENVVKKAIIEQFTFRFGKHFSIFDSPNFDL